MKKSPAGRGRTGCLGSGRRNRFCGAPQIVDLVPSLPTLDDPAPQMVEQLPDVLRFFRALSPDPEQVIEVPKILPEDVSLRTAVREPQLAEQLVGVPSMVSFSSLQRIMAQDVDIPVPHVRVPGPQGFLRGQSFSFTAEQIVDNPGFWWRSSRFTPWTEFNSVFGAVS